MSDWLMHLGITREFPRDLGFMWPTPKVEFARLPVYNAQEYISEIDRRLSSRGVFVNVYSKRQQAAGVADKLFFDVDVDGDLEAAYRGWQRLLDRFDQMGYVARSVFTGSKGFGVYIDFDEEVKVDFGSLGTLKNFCVTIDSLAGGVCDHSVFGDKNRICRVPITPNMKSLKYKDGLYWCVPVDRDWDMDRILKASRREEPAAKYQLEVSVECRRDVEALPKSMGFNTFSESLHNGPVSDITPTEISPEEREYLQELLELILQHVAPGSSDGRKGVLHYLLVPAMVRLGFDDNDIHSICRSFVEKTKMSYTTAGYATYVSNSILRTRRQGWKPLSVENFMVRYPGILP